MFVLTQDVRANKPSKRQGERDQPWCRSQYGTQDGAGRPEYVDLLQTDDRSIQSSHK